MSRVEGFMNMLLSNGLENVKEVNEITRESYKHIKSMFRYGNDTDFENKKATFLRVFEDWIPIWLCHISKEVVLSFSEKE